jgi:hypothetical protein
MPNLKNAGNIFTPIILIVTLKEHKNPTGGKYMIFFPLCLYFFPLKPCNNCSFTDDVRGENMARGKSNHTMFHNVTGNLVKNAGHRGHNIIFFLLLF